MGIRIKHDKTSLNNRVVRLLFLHENVARPPKHWTQTLRFLKKSQVFVLPCKPYYILVVLYVCFANDRHKHSHNLSVNDCFVFGTVSVACTTRTAVVRAVASFNKQDVYTQSKNSDCINTNIAFNY